MNRCGVCGLDFSSAHWFDAHRVGKHAYTFSEGLKMEPPREDGRRCLGQAELVERGWTKNEHGRWRGEVKELSPLIRERLRK